MDEQKRVPHITLCYHEAGHAVAFWHHGIQLEYVTMYSSDPGRWGETKIVDYERTSLAQIEAEMRCAVAGDIAQAEFLPSREQERAERTDDFLVRRFRNRVRDVVSGQNLRHEDYLNYAVLGLTRDSEASKNTPSAPTGSASWLPIFREAEQLIHIDGDLWPAVQAVAEALRESTGLLTNADVAALATTALSSAAQ